MTGTIIDGKAIAAALRARVADEVEALKRERGVTPYLAAVLISLCREPTLLMRRRLSFLEVVQA